MPEVYETVEVRVPAGPLGILITERESHVIVDGFAPVGVNGEQGVIEKSGRVSKGSIVTGLNGLVFEGENASFARVRAALVETNTVERVIHFKVPVNKLQTNATRSFTQEYSLGKELGAGSFSVVRQAIHKQTGEKYAVKCIERDGLSEEDIEALTTEVEILQQMKHPHIMALYDVFTEANHYYLVTELVTGGELFERIVEKNFYSEKEARDLVKTLLETIKYCHDNNVVHRDLKPENLLMTSKSDDADIKLADFGFAKRVTGDGLATACGTPGYVAPEILAQKPYGKTVDIWSIGIITYILLCGYPPFHDDSQSMLFRKIKAGKFEFDSPYWDNISVDAKDLISKMLIVDTKQRWTADQLLTHKWITGTDVATVPLTKTLEELRRFNARRRFRAAVSTVQATISLTKALSMSTKRQTMIYTNRHIRDEYTLGRELGSGAYSVVYEGINKKTGNKYAVKAMQIAGLSEDDIEAFHQEVEILKEMQHPNIMRLYAVYLEEATYYLVTELVAGGELFDRIVEKSYYSEKEARDLVKVLLDTIKFCHDRKVVHRDLKPENLLLTSKEDDANIKLADFGFAKKIVEETGLVTTCGTPGYVAPEILSRTPYGTSVDIWSIGIITYILLCGYPPFHDDNQALLFRKIKAGRFVFDSPYWDNVSEDAKDLIKKMLIVDPAERWTATQLLEHKWITGEEVSTTPLLTALEELRKYNARRRFKSAVTTVKATLSLAKTFSSGADSEKEVVTPPPAPSSTQ
ncbi:hypothetical protein Poli38472_010401 [Pythium oligandrum]|uniref:Protein kinase domain-containing protein n=1 Tax=Pythium oligandrum TaxID=41045 RepID=A0A8K1C336_PYTOL|nr:hypothetical protein Poli38472_010401 [Pythium oligandrum]|eukprot:TMW55519.1 hypothetical protein Poli38472_010401 [Pythium oligandrum]